MNTRKIAFCLLAVLVAVLSLVLLWSPFKDVAAAGSSSNANGKNIKSRSKTQGPPNYDALASSPKRPDGKQQSAERVSTEPQFEGGHPVQVEPRFDVPTFLWGSAQATAKSVKAQTLRQNTDAVAAAARSYLLQHSSDYRLKASDVAAAQIASVHDTGKGAIIVKFKQSVSGVEVFRDEINVIMNRELGLVALSGYLTGDDTGVSFSPQDFQLQPEDAISKAAQDLTGSVLDTSVLRRVGSSSNTSGTGGAGENPYILFTADNNALQDFTFDNDLLRAKKVMFHLPEGYIPAYYLEADIYVPTLDILNVSGNVMTAERAYSYVISAVDGTILFRNNLVDDVSYTYRVWADPITKIPYDTPAGNDTDPKLNPAPDGAQYPFVIQNDIALQNYPFSRNDPWLPAGSTETVGNNADAFVNLINGTAPNYTVTTTDNGYGPVVATPYDGTKTFAAGGGDFRAKSNGATSFLHTHTGGTDPSTAEARQANIQQLFYDVNFLHDWFYDSGFDEAAGNAQTDNFGRGGLANDNIKAQAQDISARNNANMLTPADGGRPRMRMYVFDTAAPKFLNVLTPAAAAGKRSVGTAQAGPQSFDLTNAIAYAAPTDACAALTNAAAASGKIVMMQYTGACSPATSFANIQNAGGIGVVLSYLGGANANTFVNITGANAAQTIPYLGISFNGAASIKSEIALSHTVTARMFRSAGTDRDGTIDNQVVFHEWGHYISNRLIGNGNGLSTNHSAGMGEGWGDFNALLSLSVRPDDINVPSNANWSGAYALATYATSGGPNGGDNQGYYYGIRRVPYSTDLTKDPLTFKHIQNGVALPNTAPISYGQDGANNAEVHNTGEVWATMLWECYAALLRDTQGGSPRLTFDEAQGRMKLYLTAAFKMTPVSPTFLEARDAVIASALAYDVTDANLFAQAFAKRGAGVRAVAPDRYSSTNSGVVESFITGGDLSYVSSQLDDSIRSCDNDGYLDSGEKGLLTVTLKNSGLGSLSNTTATISSSNAAITFPNGNTITFPASQAYENITGSVVAESAAGLSGIQTTDFTISFTDPALAIPGTITAHYFTQFNVAEVSAASATDTVEARNTVWTTGFNAAFGNATPWKRILSSTSANHLWYGSDPGFTSDQYLTSPVFTVDGSGSMNLQFDHSWGFEFDASNNYDGGVIEKSINGGAWTDMGASAYNGTITNTGDTNPLQGRVGFVKNSAGTIHTSLTQAIAPGSTVQVRFRIGSDSAAGASGWNVDNIAFTGVVETPFTVIAADTSNCSAPPNPVVVTFTQTTLPVGFVGIPYTTTLTPTGGTGPYTYTIVQPFVLPPGLTYSTVSGNLQISGTPTLSGDYPVTFKITDSASHQNNVSYTLSVVTATRSISGLVTYGTTPVGQPAKYVPNVLLSAVGSPNDAATSSASGVYSLNNLMTNGNYTVTPSKTGDINSISSFDAARIQQYIAELITLTPNQLIAADVTNNGQVSSFDAARIQQYVASGTTAGHITGQWKFVPGSRPYASVTDNLTNENYEAILVGDVSGNWTAGAVAASISKQTIAEESEETESIELFDVKKPLDAIAGFDLMFNRGNQQSAERQPLEKAVSSTDVIAAPQANIAVSLPAASSAQNGMTVTIPVTVGQLPALGSANEVISYDFALQYDPTVLSAPVASTVGTLSAGTTPTTGMPVAGRFTVSFSNGGAPRTGQGTLINIQFTVVGATGTTTALTFVPSGIITVPFQFNEGDPGADVTNGRFSALAPTAATVSVGGRVITGKRLGIGNVLVTLTGSDGQSRTALTDSLGFYSFEDVPAGGTYVISVSHKRYNFTQSAQVQTIVDDTNQVNFVGLSLKGRL